MGATEAKWAQGTTLSRNGNVIAEIKSIGGVEITQDVLEATHLTSDGDFKEFIGGLLEAGDIPVSGNFIPSDTNGQVGLLTDLKAHTAQSFAMNFPTSMGTAWTFTALVTRVKIGEATPAGIVPFDATLKITGEPVLGVTFSNNLSALTISNSAVLYPAFAAGTYDYVATVLTAVSSVTVTPTASLGVITVNGNVVASGQASSAITLGSAGSVTTITVVVKESNKAARTYTFRVGRA